MYCKKCGKEINEGLAFCAECGAAQNEAPNNHPPTPPIYNYQTPPAQTSQSGLVCPKCGSSNVNIQVQQVGARTSTKKKGCIYKLARIMLIICTCGLWLVFGKKNSTSKTAFVNTKLAICQSCGKSWTVV